VEWNERTAAFESDDDDDDDDDNEDENIDKADGVTIAALPELSQYKQRENNQSKATKDKDNKQ
jgi:hypothetical protein